MEVEAAAAVERLSSDSARCGEESASGAESREGRGA